MVERKTSSKSELTTPVRTEESFRGMLEHPLLTKQQEDLIFSMGQQDPYHPAGIEIHVPRDAISALDLQAHPLFPSFMAMFSQRDRQKSEQLFAESGTLTEYLLRHYQRRVFKIARAAQAKIVDLEVTLQELIQEGNIGLTRAINAYDPKKIAPSSNTPASFSTFSTTVIRNAVISEVRKRNRRFGTPLHVAHALKRYNAEVEFLGRQLGRTPNETEIRERFSSLGTIAPELVAQFLKNNQIVISPRSLDQPILSTTQGEGVIELGETIASSENTEETALADLAQQELLAKLFTKLTPRQRSVLLRRGVGDAAQKQTLEEIGIAEGVSRERIRQIEWVGLETLNQLLQAEIRGEEAPEIVNDHSYRSHFRRRNQEAKNRKKARQTATSVNQGTKDILPSTGTSEESQPKALTSQERDEEILALFNKGKSDLDVAIQLNRNLEVIRDIRRKYGLKRIDQSNWPVLPGNKQQTDEAIPASLREAARLMKNQPHRFEQVLKEGEERQVTSSPEKSVEKVIPPAEGTKQLPPLDPVMSIRQARKLMRKNPRTFEGLLEEAAKQKKETESQS